MASQAASSSGTSVGRGPHRAWARRVAALAMLGVAVVLILLRTAQAPVEPTAPPPAAAAATTDVPPAAAPKVAVPQPKAAALVMPDGVELPPLNGVTGAPKLIWPEGRPYAEVVGKRVVNGLEYYVHKDGSMSTTRLAWRPDLARFDATTEVRSPVAGQPLAQ